MAVFPILADPDKNNLQSAQLLIGREVVSGRVDGCRVSVLHSSSCRDRPKLEDCNVATQTPTKNFTDGCHAARTTRGRSHHDDARGAAIGLTRTGPASPSIPVGDADHVRVTASYSHDADDVCDVRRPRAPLLASRTPRGKRPGDGGTVWEMSVLRIFLGLPSGGSRGSRPTNCQRQNVLAAHRAGAWAVLTARQTQDNLIAATSLYKPLPAKMSGSPPIELAAR